MFRFIQESFLRPSMTRLGMFTHPTLTMGRFFGTQDSASRLPFSRIIQSNMNSMAEALHQLEIPAAQHANVTKLLMAHSSHFNFNPSEKSYKPQMLANIISSLLKKIFTTVNAKPGNIEEAVQTHQAQIEILNAPLQDFQFIQKERDKETSSLKKTIDLSSEINLYQSQINTEKNKIEDLQFPEKVVYKKLTSANLRLLGSDVNEKGSVMYTSKKINNFEKYKDLVLEIQTACANKSFKNRR